MFAFAQNTASKTALGILGTIIGASLCLGAAAGPANAQSANVDASDAPRTAKVVFNDLNLAKADHRKLLDARLSDAARRVCAMGGGSVAERAAEARCQQAALKAAAPQRLAATLGGVG